MSTAHGWRHRFGAAAEVWVERYLAARGLRIVARRYRAGRGEIDLIAREAGVLVFIEVKARRRRDFGTAPEAVNARKQYRLASAARAYLREAAPRYREIRFDVVALHGDGRGRLEVQWLRDAFRP